MNSPARDSLIDTFKVAYPCNPRPSYKGTYFQKLKAVCKALVRTWADRNRTTSFVSGGQTYTQIKSHKETFRTHYLVALSWYEPLPFKVVSK